MENQVTSKQKFKDFFAAIEHSSLLPVVYFCFLLVTYVASYYVSQTLSLVIVVAQTLGAMLLVLVYREHVNPVSFALFFLLMVFCAISYFTHFSGMEYLCNTVKLSCLLLICPCVKFSKKQIAFCMALLALYALAIIALAVPGAPDLKEEQFIDRILPYNPNTSGFILSLFAICFLVAAAQRENKIIKLASLIIAALLFGFLFYFKSRTAMAGIILFAVAFAACKYIFKLKPNVYGLLTLLACVGGIIFAYVYIVLFNEIGHGKLLIFGKDVFTGRQYIWSDAFNQLSGHYAFGIGNTLHSIQIGSQVSEVTNLHNQMMGYLTIFGIFAFSAFALLISRQAKLLAQKKQKRIGSILFLLTLIAMSYFDTIMYSSANSAIVCCVILLLSAIENAPKPAIALKKELR